MCRTEKTKTLEQTFYRKRLPTAQSRKLLFFSLVCSKHCARRLKWRERVTRLLTSLGQINNNVYYFIDDEFKQWKQTSKMETKHAKKRNRNKTSHEQTHKHKTKHVIIQWIPVAVI